MTDTPTTAADVEDVLKPCPYCKGPALLDDNESNPYRKRDDGPILYAVHCASERQPRCPGGVMFLDHPSKASAIAAWNTRPIENQQRAEIVKQASRIAFLEGQVKGLTARLNRVDPPGYAVSEQAYAISEEQRAEREGRTPQKDPAS